MSLPAGKTLSKESAGRYGTTRGSRAERVFSPSIGNRGAGKISAAVLICLPVAAA
jgi:hypothetical protein